MLKQLSTRLLQHLIAQNSWANALLQPYAGQSVRIHIGLISPTLIILEDGSLALAGDTNTPDATVTIPPTLLLRLIAKDETAKSQINITGDTHLATELAKVFAHMRWDYEDDLSKLVGDIPAYQIADFGRKAVGSIKETSTNLAEMLREYWQEEMPVIAKKRHVEQFNSEVDTLRADVARLEKKLLKFEKKLTQTLSSPTDTHNP